MAADNHMGQMRVGFAGFDEAGQMMQHNPAQADAPDIPFEILQKIAAIAKIIAPDCRRYGPATRTELQLHALSALAGHPWRRRHHREHGSSRAEKRAG